MGIGWERESIIQNQVSTVLRILCSRPLLLLFIWRWATECFHLFTQEIFIGHLFILLYVQYSRNVNEPNTKKIPGAPVSVWTMRQ